MTHRDPWPYENAPPSYGLAREEWPIPPDVEPIEHQETPAMNPDSLAAPLVRIGLRYLSGALVTWGLVTPETGASIIADTELQAALLIVVGAAIAAVTEWAYARARKTGGPT